MHPSRSVVMGVFIIFPLNERQIYGIITAKEHIEVHHAL